MKDYKEKEDEIQEEFQEIIEESIPDFSTNEGSQLLPTMNVNSNAPPKEEKKEDIITDKALLGIYDEIMGDLRKDREEVSEILTSVVNLVINDGDSTGASKEAMVNLMKIKTEISDKKAKVADLMTRLKMKERYDAIPRYLAAQQNNTIKIETSDKKQKRDFLKMIEQQSRDK